MSADAENAVLVAVPKVSAVIGQLPLDAKVTVLMSALAQEICCLPPSERAAALAEVMRDMPEVFDGTQEGMREGLVMRARGQ